MAFRGDRFELDLESPPTPNTTLPLIKDIHEKQPTTAPTAPVAPSLPSTGFPQPKRRNKPSLFKARAAATSESAPPPPPPQPRHEPGVDKERAAIDAENTSRIASMSEDEIHESQRALYEQFGEGLLQRLLQRQPKLPERPASRPSPVIPKPAQPEEPKETNEPKGREETKDPQEPTRRENATAHADTVHFVKPSRTRPEMSDPDPDSPEFLEQLRTKYFPDLPTDPSKLEWMKPVAADEDIQAYHPSLESLPTAALRFDFRGQLLPPSKALELPSHLGLHHHSAAPGAAGYTILELAHLSRSAFPAQRCVAMQTLGRVMLRFGRGDFGPEITPGLEDCLREGRVLETLQEAASQEGGHWGVRNYAIEALWNWQLGNGTNGENEANDRPEI